MLSKKAITYLFVEAPAEVLLELISRDALIRHLRTVNDATRQALLSGDGTSETVETPKPKANGAPKRRAAQGAYEPDEDAIAVLNVLASGDTLSLDEIAEEAGITPTIAGRRCRALFEAKRIERIGKARNTKYFDPQARGANGTLASGPLTDAEEEILATADAAYAP